MLDHEIYFVGIDRGRTLHQVCIHDQDGQVAAHRTYRHFAEHLKIGLVLPSRTMVLVLQPIGMTAWLINPKQSSRIRDRFSVALSNC